MDQRTIQNLRERERERERAIYDDSERLDALIYCHKENHYRYIRIVPESTSGFY